MTVTVTLHSILDAGPKQIAIAHRACALLEAALNDPRFPAMVAAENYRETRFADASGAWRSVAVSDIADMVFAGRERGTEADAEIDLEVRLDGFRRGILGSTLPGVLPFRTAYWFINDCIQHDEPAELAGHFMHEWLHVSGFYHWPDNGARDDVAYHLGNIVRRLARGDAKTTSAMPDWLEIGHCGTDATGNEDTADEKAGDIDRMAQ